MVKLFYFSLDGTLTGATTPGQGRPENNGKTAGLEPQCGIRYFSLILIIYLQFYDLT